MILRMTSLSNVYDPQNTKYSYSKCITRKSLTKVHKCRQKIRIGSTGITSNVNTTSTNLYQKQTKKFQKKKIIPNYPHITVKIVTGRSLTPSEPTADEPRNSKQDCV